MISVAMATYNGAKYIEQQIESILNQTIDDIELIICDDASTDETADIVKKFASIDPRVRLYINEVQLGVVKNFEKAIKLCKGNYIALSDQDDIWLPEKLVSQLNLYNREKSKSPSEPLLLFHDLVLIDETGNVINNSFFRLFKIKKFGIVKNIFYNNMTGCTTFFDRNTSNSFLPFLDKMILHDHIMSLSCNLFGRCIQMSDALIYFRRHSSNYTNTNKSEEFFSKLKKQVSFQNQLAYINYILENDSNKFPLFTRFKLIFATKLGLLHPSLIRLILKFF